MFLNILFVYQEKTVLSTHEGHLYRCFNKKFLLKAGQENGE